VDLNTPIISKIIDNWIDEDIGSGDLTSSSITERMVMHIGLQKKRVYSAGLKL